MTLTKHQTIYFSLMLKLLCFPTQWK